MVDSARESGRVVLVRHADAGDRNAASPSDYLRPLSLKGEWQATAIAEILLAFEPWRIVSSRATRCLSTVAPLGERCHLDVEELDVLFEGNDPRSCWSELLELASDREGTLVACSHGDVIPGIVELLEDAGVDHRGFPKIKKGSMVVIGLQGGDASRLDFIAAPQREGVK